MSIHEDRVEALRAVMDRHGVDRVILDGPEHVAYFCGYTPPTAMYQGAVITRTRAPILVVRGNNKSAAAHAYAEKTITYADWADPIGLMARVLKETGQNGPIGKDMSSMVMTAQRQARLAELVPGIQLVDISRDIAALRATKQSEEIDLHRTAAVIADEAMKVGLTALVEGRTIQEAGLEAHQRARLLGADDRRTVVAKMEQPDPDTPGPQVAMIELVPAVKGYDARCIRAVALGEPSPEQLENARRVIEIQDRQIEAMMPGALAREVDAICREAMLDGGLRTTYEGLTGHGIGFSWAGNTTDTTFAFTPGSEWVLRAGMIFHMYTRARGFVIGDTVLVTESGPEILTTLPRRLMASANDWSVL